MPRYKLAIFDFDGTLADSLSWFTVAMNEAADRFGFRRVDAAEAEMLRGRTAWQVIEHVGMPMWKAPMVTRYMRARLAREAPAIPLFPGVGAALEALAERGVVLSIVSTNSEANVRRVLGARHAALVSHYGCSASLFGKRPKLRRVLAASGVAPAEALCIGDELRDLHAARAERIPFGAVAWGFTKVEALAAHAPEELFHRVEEIADRFGSGQEGGGTG